MARPLKDGIDYFPFDVGFLRDKKVKLLTAEFASEGVHVLLAILCDIYGGSGYYLLWDEDTCTLLSQSLGGKCTPKLVQQVVEACVKRALFSKRLFGQYHVLTSKGIQRRYVRALVGREEIRIKKEYWLLDQEDDADVPRRLQERLRFSSVSGNGKTVFSGEKEVSDDGNTQRKEKNTKKENTREEELFFIDCGVMALPQQVGDKLRAWLVYKKERGDCYKKMGLTALVTLTKNKTEDFGEQAVCMLIDMAMANGWRGIPWDRLQRQTASKIEKKLSKEKREEIEAYERWCDEKVFGKNYRRAQ